MGLTRDEIIDDLIENTEYSSWTEDDREMLEGMADGTLVRMHNMAAATAAAVTDNEDEEDGDGEEEEESPAMKRARRTRKPTRNAMDGDEDMDDEDEAGGQATQRIPFGKGKVSKGKGKITGLSSRQQVLRDSLYPAQNQDEEVDVEDFIANAPRTMQTMLRNGVAIMERQKTSLVDLIDNHSNNIFDRAWLEDQEMEVLEGMAALAGVGSQARQANYLGQAGGPINPLRNEVKEEALPLPAMDWSSPSKAGAKA